MSARVEHHLDAHGGQYVLVEHDRLNSPMFCNTLVIAVTASCQRRTTAADTLGCSGHWAAVETLAPLAFINRHIDWQNRVFQITDEQLFIREFWFEIERCQTEGLAMS